MIFLKSLGSIFPIIVMIAIGYILKKRHWFHHTFSENVSKLITNVALPCSIFYSVLKYLKLEECLYTSTNASYPKRRLQ